MTAELTPEQQQLLTQLEDEFADRYTDKDPDYTKVVTPSTPPVISPWYNHPRRQYDYTDNNRNNRDHRERWRGKHHRRDRDRHEHRHQPYHRYR